MKAHLAIDNNQTACKVFGRCLKGDYEVLPLERFKKVYIKQPDYCCKKCLNYLKNKKELI